MLCTAIKGPSLKEVERQLAIAMDCADLVELRLDLFDSWNIQDIKELRSQFQIPMISTLRSSAEGGKFLGPEEERLKCILQLAAMQPEYMDLEHHASNDLIGKIQLQHPSIKIILSYHQFSGMPVDLDALYAQMRKTRADFYKMAVTPNNSLDAIRLLCWMKEKKIII